MSFYCLLVSIISVGKISFQFYCYSLEDNVLPSPAAHFNTFLLALVFSGLFRCGFPCIYFTTYSKSFWFSDLMSFVNLGKFLASVFSKVASATFPVSTPLDSITNHKIFHCPHLFLIFSTLYSILFSLCFNLNIFY